MTKPPYILSPEDIERQKDEERQNRLVCTRKAFRLALSEENLLESFKKVGNTYPDFTIWFEDTRTFRRTNPYLQQVWFEYLEWGESTLQQVFDRAMEIDVQYPE